MLAGAAHPLTQINAPLPSQQKNTGPFSEPAAMNVLTNPVPKQCATSEPSQPRPLASLGSPPPLGDAARGYAPLDAATGRYVMER